MVVVVIVLLSVGLLVVRFSIDRKGGKREGKEASRREVVASRVKIPNDKQREGAIVLGHHLIPICCEDSLTSSGS